MITLNVYFIAHNKLLNGTGRLIENLISNKVDLEISADIFVDETKALINKAVEILSKRYEKVNVVINLNSLKEVKNND